MHQTTILCCKNLPNISVYRKGHLTQQPIASGKCPSIYFFFDAEHFDFRCLAHIINLVTQALITTHSKSKHYNPAEPNADLLGNNIKYNMVGLVQAICVKVCMVFSYL